MLAIIRSSRYSDLLKKEALADAINSDMSFKAEFAKLERIDLASRLDEILIDIKESLRACEIGSVVSSRLYRAGQNISSLRKEIEPSGFTQPTPNF